MRARTWGLATTPGGVGWGLATAPGGVGWGLVTAPEGVGWGLATTPGGVVAALGGVGVGLVAGGSGVGVGVCVYVHVCCSLVRRRNPIGVSSVRVGVWFEGGVMLMLSIHPLRGW